MDRAARRRDRRNGRQAARAPAHARSARAHRAGRDRQRARRARGAGRGGGGKGLKIARTIAEIEPAFETARREAEAYFGNGTIYAERYLENPKHVELQILADKHGSVVHVGERDCSLQRRHQKLWEEAPPEIPERVRAAMREAGLRAAKAIGYDSAGTMECLVTGDAFYFLEMNTHIQVEHTVSEMISVLDLVREQIRVAAGEPLGITQNDIAFRGFSIEARVNAEDPAQEFRPAPGTIVAYREPAGPGVRVDSAAYEGWTIPREYDSLVAKLIVWAPTRERAIARLRRAIDEYVIEGIPTTLPLLRALCDHPAVANAGYGTATLESFAREWKPPARVPSFDGLSGRLGRPRIAPGVTKRLAPRLGTLRKGRNAAGGNAVLSPMHGLIVELRVAEGDRVSEGQVVAVIEAMKMMNEIRAHRDGVVSALMAGAGSSVESGSALLSIADG